MGQSPSKPITGTTAERTALTMPENRPPTLVLHPRHDSPVSPLSRHSQRSSIPSHAIRIEGHESGGVIRIRRGSDMALMIDTGSTVVDSDRSQINYGQSWGREAQSLYVGRTQPLRSEPEAYECRSPATSDRVFEIQSIRERPSLRIICPLLQGVLKRASVNSLSAFQREELFSPASTIIEPYEWLFHNRKKIMQAAREDTAKHTSSHVDLLLEFIKKERPTTWEKLDELDLGECRKISFGDLWLIYPAGATVFAKDNGEWRAYKVERTELSCRSGTDAMLIHCLYLDLKTTGQWLTPQQEVLTVHSYSLERTIGDLEVVPDWHFGCSGLSEKLIEQGKKFWNCSRKVNYKEYHGHAWPRSSRNFIRIQSKSSLTM
ncbi:hypothetical protein HD806DRAFT_242322 [Xylariaceae sp. AK1471]|nr:hypothetical protein HD806DRAFT_242322 [Xylariaceae sp. AK1471]